MGTRGQDAAGEADGPLAPSNRRTKAILENGYGRTRLYMLHSLRRAPRAVRGGRSSSPLAPAQKSSSSPAVIFSRCRTCTDGSAAAISSTSSTLRARSASPRERTSTRPPPSPFLSAFSFVAASQLRCSASVANRRRYSAERWSAGALTVVLGGCDELSARVRVVEVQRGRPRVEDSCVSLKISLTVACECGRPASASWLDAPRRRETHLAELGHRVVVLVAYHPP